MSSFGLALQIIWKKGYVASILNVASQTATNKWLVQSEYSLSVGYAALQIKAILFFLDLLPLCVFSLIVFVGKDILPTNCICFESILEYMHMVLACIRLALDSKVVESKVM